MSHAGSAAAINKKFKTAYSRNATLGRARRMGLAGPVRSIDLPNPLLQTSPSILQKTPKRDFLKLWPSPVFERMESVKLRCVETDPRHLSLIELERNDCRYPYGGDAESEAITFCGRRRRAGSSYCTPHFRLSRGPGTARERDACRALLNWCKQQERQNHHLDERAAALSLRRKSTRADRAAAVPLDPPEQVAILRDEVTAR
jgi:GcrA cell cycle regulator